MFNDFILNSYLFKINHQFDNCVDFEIYQMEKQLGVIQLTVQDNVFIRQIHINEDFCRQGHATTIVNSIQEYYKKPITLCIATVSESAIHFWKTYFSTKEDVVNVRGNIYKINL